MTIDYELVSPADVASWRAFHDIRREVLFEARGHYGIYDENHPDDRVPGHHLKLLLHRGDPVGVIRIDISGHDGVLRRVAIRSELQRAGHGRTMLSLAEAFAVSHGCGRLASHVARDAVGFYEKCGFSRAQPSMADSPDGESILMTKLVSATPLRSVERATTRSSSKRGGNRMKLYTYLNYGGNCAQAFRFYEEQLGGRIMMMTTHGEQPNAANVPADWKNAVLHARIEIGDTVVMGADVPPDRFQPMRSAYLTLIVDRAEEADRLYSLLSDGGQIFMKMEKTFFANRFAMLRDRFGTSWMLLHEPADE